MNSQVVTVLSFCVTIIVNGGQGVELLINDKSSYEGAPEGARVVLTCSGESSDTVRIGELNSLSIETYRVEKTVTRDARRCWLSPHVKHTYTMEPLVTVRSNDEKIWGSAARLYQSRATVTGTVSTSIALQLEGTICNDTMNFVCVARGPLGSADSEIKSLTIFSIPDTPRITGGRSCTSYDYIAKDHCTHYAKEGEVINLQCEGKIGLPLGDNTLEWKSDSNIIIEDTYTSFENFTNDDCAGRAEGTIRFYQGEEEETKISCVITHERPNSTMVFQRSSQAIICKEVPQMIKPNHMKQVDQNETSANQMKQAGYNDPFTCNKSHIVGSFFGGVGAVLILFIIFLLLLCCCGYSLKITNKRKGRDLQRMK